MRRQCNESLNMTVRHLPMSRSLRICAYAAVLAVFFTSPSAAASILRDARVAIQQVHAASANEDYSALRRLMVRDFQWSFGGDADVQQALDAWKADTKYFKNLRRVTGQQCSYRTQEIVECPAKAGTAFRAGFAKTADGWRMRYFVEGD